MDLDFRFRAAELDSPLSLAFSKAPHAFFSSRVCSTGCGRGVGLTRGAKTFWMLLAKTSRAPKRLAMLSRCCQRWCSWRSRSRSCCDRR